MKIIEPNVQEVTDFEGVDNFYKAVARAARICYANYNRITKLHKEGTYKCTDNWYSQEKIIAVKGKSYEVKKVNNDFVLIGENGHNAHNFNTQCFESWFFKYFENPDDKALVERLIESKHFSPFEHAIISIKDDYSEQENFIADVYMYTYSHDYTIVPDGKSYIIANGRVIVESVIKAKINNHYLNSTIELLDSVLEYFKKLEINTNEFRSFIVDTNIGCTRELNRHDKDFYYTDPLNICEQSTRFCNFSKDKFDNQIAFNKPYWYDDSFDTDGSRRRYIWESAMQRAEMSYKEMLSADMTLDQVRGCLPLDTHTRAIYTSTIEEWKHIIDLRLYGTTGKPHGDIKIIAEKINQIINK